MIEKKVTLRGKSVGLLYHAVELPLSDLANQLTMEEYWDLGIEMHRLKKDCPNDPECPFCECGQEWVNHDPNKCKPAECEHEWEYTAPPHRNQRCIKCGVKRIEPTQKPKIEELKDITFHNYNKDRWEYHIQKCYDKINELVKAVNGLYEREK